MESNISSYNFLAQGGKMGNLIRNYDWTQTPIGSPDQWPQSLQTTVSILLNSGFPMFLFWGDDLIQFYNDAFRPSLGNNGKHPEALGQKGKDCWPETWTTIKPLIDQVRSGGGATWSEHQLIPIYRNGKIEDVYWTFSYSPVNDEKGNIGGILVVCNETTNKVIEERNRLNIILSTQEEERRRISEDLRNGIAQLLYAAQLKLEVVIGNKNIDQGALKEVHALIQECTEETKTISFELMPSILIDFGLKETINELCKKKQSSNLEIFYIYSGPDKRLGNLTETAIYRILQELINNIVKHSNASRANVHCDILENKVRIYVEDNGKGFLQQNDSSVVGQMGLRNIKNRVELINGVIDIKTAPGEGTQIIIEIPL